MFTHENYADEFEQAYQNDALVALKKESND